MSILVFLINTEGSSINDVGTKLVHFVGPYFRDATFTLTLNLKSPTPKSLNDNKWVAN